MNLNYYSVFYHVAILQNITLASKKLNISQPSISRAIALLEFELDKTLFIRSKKGVKLTQDGQILFDYVAKGLNWIKKGEMEITKTDEKENNLILGASQLTIKSFLPPLLQQFELQYPNVNLSIQTSSSLQIIDKLMGGLIDVAIVPDPIEINRDLEIINLMSINNVLIGGQKYKFLEGKELSLSDLSKYPFISLSQGTAGRKWFDQLCVKNSVEITPSIEVQTSDLIVPLVRHNLGLGIVADIFIQEAIQTRDIMKLAIKETLPKRNFVLCYNKTKQLSHISERFIELIHNGKK